MLLRLPCFNEPNIQRESYSCPQVTAASRNGCQRREHCTQPGRTVLALGKCQMCNCNSKLSQSQQHGPGKARGRSNHQQRSQGTRQTQHTLSSTAHPSSTKQGQARGRCWEQASQPGHQVGRHSEPGVGLCCYCHPSQLQVSSVPPSQYRC